MFLGTKLSYLANISDNNNTRPKLTFLQLRESKLLASKLACLANDAKYQ